ncbi:hypothetical protein L6452_40773 [Arctium lappa]|uniref:Uncharacterized protein n=1 Tax=Arctium lappa TaxID=4217 RepID=A0ACB8XMU7_ARCLA|nr:hypothetical protein L6452_40773 [Arctium lappa]
MKKPLIPHSPWIATDGTYIDKPTAPQNNKILIRLGILNPFKHGWNYCHWKPHKARLECASTMKVDEPFKAIQCFQLPTHQKYIPQWVPSHLITISVPNLGHALWGAPGIGLLAQLAATKVVATTLCKGSGLVGGFYAPSLMIGVAVGAVFRGSTTELINSAIPGNAAIVEPHAYALVGMAATLASVCSVPLTAVLLLFELTTDYRIFASPHGNFLLE